MSIIQTIRDRAAVIMFVIIGVSLIAFLLQDAFTGRGGMGTQSTTIGSVNGNDIEYATFQKQMEMQESQYAQSGMQINESMRQNIMEGVWNQFVSEELLTKETEELGIKVTDKELNDMFFGDNPPQDLRREFTDPKTGQFNADALRQAIQQLKAQKNTPQAESFANVYIPALLKNRAQEKYVSLVSAATYLPKWMTDKINADNSAIANISFVGVPYGTIADSTIKVTDEDILKYIGERKDQYKQEKTRSVVYVSFDASATGKDSAQILAQLNEQRAEFASTTDMENFLNRTGTEIAFHDGYVQSSKLQVPNADTIRQLAEGQVFGPYLDQNNYVFARMMSKRTMPDSVKVRHILIKTADSQSGPVRADSTAKRLIDSIALAAKNGANFEELVKKYSDDGGSKETKGEYDFASTANLVKPFYEVAFYKPAGTKEVIKNDGQGGYSGYHYVEVISQKNFEQALKVAYLAKAIIPSTETESHASNAATLFAGESRSVKAFTENVKKQNLQEFVAGDIHETDFSIQGIGPSRAFVRAIYAADKGDVLEPQNVGDKYIVAAITEVNAEGTMSAAKARPMVEVLVRNQKKAEAIRKKIGSANTLEAIALAGLTQVMHADSVSFASTFIQGAGSEPKVVGAAFDKNNQAKVSQLIDGTSGVFAVKTTSVGARPVDFAQAQQMKESMQQQMSSSSSRSALEALKKAAKIKDNRAKFY